MELLRISMEIESGQVVCRISGDLDASSSPRLRSALAEQLEAGSDVVVDLSGLGFVDSSGLGVLVGALKRFGAGGHALSLRAPTASFHRVLETTGLSKAFVVEP